MTIFVKALSRPVHPTFKTLQRVSVSQDDSREARSRRTEFIAFLFFPRICPYRGFQNFCVNSSTQVSPRSGLGIVP
jgi:hypothetical protein